MSCYVRAELKAPFEHPGKFVKLDKVCQDV